MIAANSKSGDNTAAEVLSAFRGILNPIQVFELNSGGPKNALNLVAKLSPVQCRILVAGGDGSVGWVLNVISSQLKRCPMVWILFCSFSLTSNRCKLISKFPLQILSQHQRYAFCRLAPEMICHESLVGALHHRNS